MGYWDDAQDSRQQYDNYQPDNQASFGHEALAGAASFGAFKMFEDRQRQEGKPVSHQFAKELLVGFAGAEVDRLAETKGMDYVDREKAKRHAQQHTERMYDEQYGGYNQYDPRQQESHGHLDNYNNW